MTPPIYDLFGEVPVTRQDIADWLRAVPRIDPDGPRAARYVRLYDVPGKIRAAKERGLFDQVVARPAPSQWWQRFGWPV